MLSNFYATPESILLDKTSPPIKRGAKKVQKRYIHTRRKPTRNSDKSKLEK